MSKTKTEVIAEILPLLKLPPHELSKMNLELQTHTVPELNAYLSVVAEPQYKKEIFEEEILRVQAERAADFAIFQLQCQKQTAPQRKLAAAAQLEQDKESYAEICRQHSLSECEANFNLWRSTH